MKAAAPSLIALSLVLAVLGAVTAYLPLLRLPDDQLIGLTLNAPAGAVRDETGALKPLVPRNTTITPEILAQLRSAGVTRVRVKEFGFARWTGAYVFLAGGIGLFAGSMLVRRRTASALAITPGISGATDPVELLGKIRHQVEQLTNELQNRPADETSRRNILERLGDLQRVELPLFTGAQHALVRQIGLAAYARLMDSFAAAERQLNRAWSAAADDVVGEAVDCVRAAAPLLTEAERTLRAQTASGPGDHSRPA